jgi:hypothetical protein
MPKPSRKPPKSNAVLFIVLGSAALVLLGCVGIGGYFLLKKGSGPSLGLPGRAALDPNDVANTGAWAKDAVGRLKAGKADAAGVEKEAKDSLLGKKVRWSFPVEAVDEGEVKIDTFFGDAAGKYEGADPKLKGKPLRRVYLRVYFEADKDNVKVGDEVSKLEAARLNKGDRLAVVRTVTKVEVRKDDPWFSQSPYTGVVDVLEPFCIDVTVERK